ncbi:MAG: hypothetical protein AMXMBFR13_27780 [Phycisphaerae bacterium]
MRQTARLWPRRDTLSFRLNVAINSTAVLVLVAFWTVDYRREKHLHLDEQVERLSEEASTLSLAHQRLGAKDAKTFADYLDAYCEQMADAVSPGHHILVFDSNGRIVARAHSRAETHLEANMASADPGGSPLIFSHTGQDYLAVAVPSGPDSRLVVAQSLAPVWRVIRRQAISRAISVTVLVATVVAITNLLLARWIRQPIQRLVEGVEAIRHARFDHRVPPLVTAEMRFLADGFNRMSGSLQETRHREQQEMDKARRIHLGLLPSDAVRIPGLSVHARYLPAASIGGDYYDILPYADGRWLLAVADVSGHGLSAALVTAMLKAQLRQFARQATELTAIVQALNSELESLVGTEHFVTCLLALYQPAPATLEYVNCGHEAGIILRPAEAGRILLKSDGFPLGVVRDAAWDVRRIALQPGNRLCILTDGLPEALDLDGNLFGRDRLMDLLSETADRPLAAQTAAILREVGAFRGTSTFLDDVTLVIIEREETLPSTPAGKEAPGFAEVI